MITGLAHVCFMVADLEASIAFYQGKLGFSHAFDFINNDGKRFGVYLHIGGRNFIELFEGKLDQPAKGKSYRHFCLEVDDIKATASELRSQGVEVSEVKMGSGELPPHKCGSFLLHRRALLHLFSTSVNSGCPSPTTQRFGSLGQRKTVVKCADYFGIGFTQQP